MSSWLAHFFSSLFLPLSPQLTLCLLLIVRRPLEGSDTAGRLCFYWIMASAQREASAETEESEWAGISESGDDDMDFEVSGWLVWFVLMRVWFGKSWVTWMDGLRVASAKGLNGDALSMRMRCDR